MVVAMENALYYFTCFFHNYFTIFFTSSCKNLEGIFLGSSSWEPHRELGHKIQQSLEDPSTSTILFVRIFTEMSLSAHGSGGFSSKPRWADLSCSSWLRGDRFPWTLHGVSKKNHGNGVCWLFSYCGDRGDGNEALRTQELELEIWSENVYITNASGFTLIQGKRRWQGPFSTIIEKDKFTPCLNRSKQRNWSEGKVADVFHLQKCVTSPGGAFTGFVGTRAGIICPKFFLYILLL